MTIFLSVLAGILIGGGLVVFLAACAFPVYALGVLLAIMGMGAQKRK